MRLLSWLIFIPFATIVVTFAVSNRELIDVTFWPLPFHHEIPLYLLSLGTMAFGFFFGALLTWLSVAKWRVVAASRKRDVEYAQAEADRLRDRLKEAEAKAQNTPKQELLPAVKGDVPAVKSNAA